MFFVKRKINNLLNLLKKLEKLDKLDLMVSTLFDDKFGYDCFENYKSQLGADLWCLKNSNFKKNGFFVEFGAYDGIEFSNTYLLENSFNWNGVLAEPQKTLFQKAKTNRKCLVANELISCKSGEKIEFLESNDPLATMVDYMEEDTHKKERKNKLYKDNVYTFTSISLDDFLKKYNCPKDIDYMSIDTEGSEFSILEQFPFERWNIKMFTIEHNYSSNREKIYSLMSKNGYRRIKRYWDDWFIKDI